MLRLRVAVVLIVTLVLAAGANSLGQTTTKPINNEYGKGTETTTVETNGDLTTTTIVTALKSQVTVGGEKYDITSNETRSEVRDAAGRLLKSETNYVTEKRLKGTLVSTYGYNARNEYNADGSFTNYWHSDDEDDVRGNARHTQSVTQLNADRVVVGGEETSTTQHLNEEPVVRKKTFVNGQWQVIGMALPAPAPFPLAPGDGAAGEFVALPDVAGPSSEIVGTFEDPAQKSGQQSAIVAFEDGQGRSTYFRIAADAEHNVHFKTLADTVRARLFKSFDKDGKPDRGAVTMSVAREATVPGTTPVSKIAPKGLAIARASSVYERANGFVSLQTRGADPPVSHVLLDGAELGIRTLAASDLSVKAQLGEDVSLGTHRLSVRSGGAISETVPVDVVRLRADPIPPQETGAVNTVTVHCDGLPRSHPAVMYFQVGGAAQLADGGETATATVNDGIAQVRIRGTRSGQALVRYKLHVVIPGSWDT